MWRICVEYDISFSSVCRWVQQYKHGGYEEVLRNGPCGRPRKDMGRPKKQEPQTELEKLQARVQWLEAENALLKKAKALMEEKESRKQSFGRRSSKH